MTVTPSNRRMTWGMIDGGASDELQQQRPVELCQSRNESILHLVQGNTIAY